MFYQGGLIDHVTHVTGPVVQSSAESEYNTVCTSGMALAYFSILINKLLNKDPDIVPEASPLIILYIKSTVCMDNNGKYTKNKRHIARIVYILRNGE